MTNARGEAYPAWLVFIDRSAPVHLASALIAQGRVTIDALRGSATVLTQNGAAIAGAWRVRSDACNNP
jgi:hypothetical protein